MSKDRFVEETAQYLQEYLRIPTVNPPGNEMEGVRFFKRIFDKESISYEVFEPSANRGSILATLKGDGTRKPLLLLTHIDVVPVEREQWEVNPFGGVIKDGYLYGRGAIDNKSMGIVELMVLLLLKQEKVPLKRDILFFASADEEAGGRWGVQWALDNVPSLKQAEYALNEGLTIILDEDGRPDRYEVSCGQKVFFHLLLKARGRAGHASIPHSDNPNTKLIHGLERVTTWETPYKIIPMVKEYFSKRAPKQPGDKKKWFEDIEKGLMDPSFSKEFASNVFYNAIVRDTVTLTTFHAGNKTNVIPSESIATLDCRLIPGFSKEVFLKEVKERLGNEIEVEVITESQSVPPTPSDTELFRAFERYAAAHDPGCPVVPLLFPGGTDSRFLREKGIAAYDFRPFRLTEQELMRVHGHNERIALENLGFGVRMMAEIVKEIAT